MTACPRRRRRRGRRRLGRDRLARRRHGRPGRPRAPDGRRRRRLRARARRARRAVRALPLRRLDPRPGRAARRARGLRALRRPLRARVGGRADRHGDAARDARARDRLADPAPVRARRALVGPPPRRLGGRVPRGDLRRLARARRDLRRGLHRAPRRHGARAPARLVVVAPRLGGADPDRAAARLRRPVPHHRARPARIPSCRRRTTGTSATRASTTSRCASRR